MSEIGSISSRARCTLHRLPEQGVNRTKVLVVRGRRLGGKHPCHGNVDDRSLKMAKILCQNCG